MTSQPVAYSSSSSSNIFKHTPGFGLAGRRIQSRVNNSKRRLSDLHEKEEPRPVNTTASEAVSSPAQMAASTQKRGRRSLFEECQERLACNSGASEQSGSGLNNREQQEASFRGQMGSAVTDSASEYKAVEPEDVGQVDDRDAAGAEISLMEDVTRFGSDPAEVTSPVKRTPLLEAPPHDGFHRTFQPFDMLRSPTSLGGQSFQDLNAHLAQNAKLSTRQRSLRAALRTATKEYVPAEEPMITEPAVVADIRAAPEAAGAVAQPLMVAVTRGGVVNPATLVSRSQGSGFISINRLPEVSAQSTSQGVSIRRCIF